jgi:hypothetical protein
MQQDPALAEGREWKPVANELGQQSSRSRIANHALFERLGTKFVFIDHDESLVG